MSNIRLFFSNTISANMTDRLNKSQSHYLTKVMRVKENEVFSIFNKNGEWEVKVLGILKGIVEFNFCTNALIFGTVTENNNISP